MNKTLLFLLVLLSSTAFAQNNPPQNNPTAEAQPIVAEGKLLYQSEMASWYGTDLFLEKYKNRENIGGYFSYSDSLFIKCVFFSKSDRPRVIGTILFDYMLDINASNLILTEREFSQLESDLYTIRALAIAEVDTDTMFKTYKNTNLNFVPLIQGKDKKVYVLTAPQSKGVVIFGNDYLMTFDEQNKLLVKKPLHRNIIPVYFQSETEEGGKNMGAMHNHLPETGQFMTTTDICTLMLYEQFANWEQHLVTSAKYLNIWNCKTNQLVVVSREDLDNAKQEPEKGRKKGKKKKGE